MPRKPQILTEHLNVRLPAEEMEALRRFCEQTQRTQADVIREFVRHLPTASHLQLPLPQSIKEKA